MNMKDFINSIYGETICSVQLIEKISTIRMMAPTVEKEKLEMKMELLEECIIDLKAWAKEKGIDKEVTAEIEKIKAASTQRA